MNFFIIFIILILANVCLIIYFVHKLYQSKNKYFRLCEKHIIRGHAFSRDIKKCKCKISSKWGCKGIESMLKENWKYENYLFRSLTLFFPFMYFIFLFTPYRFPFTRILDVWRSNE